MSTADGNFRRLAARGYFEITPAVRYVPSGTETGPDGRTWEVSRPQNGVHLVWAPSGQGKPGGDGRFNPFCSRSWWARTVAEALELAVEATSPPWHSLESLVDHMLYEQDKAAGRLAS